MKVGTDIVHISRIKEMDDYSLKRIFHSSELENKDILHLAGILAVKEAGMKIKQDMNWLNYEVIKKKGKPFLEYKEGFKGDISISHDGEYAVAVVLSED